MTLQELNMKMIELKATAYDIVANIEYLQNELRKVNSQISEVAQMIQGLPKEDVPA